MAAVGGFVWIWGSSTSGGLVLEASPAETVDVALAVRVAATLDAASE